MIHGLTLALEKFILKINGFETQEEFLREYPRFSTIAIFDLDDGKRPVKRVVEYIKVNG